jgi:ribonuclease Z
MPPQGGREVTTMRPYVTILGSADVLPPAGGDTASFLINGRVLVDAGWYGALNMLRYGHDPLAVEYLIITHFHHDHYLGLPHLLFYRAMARARQQPASPLRIVAPPADLEKVLERTHAFLQAERFPVVWPPIEPIPLRPGEQLKVEARETEPGFILETCPSIHGVEGICCRFVDGPTGAGLAFSGDTAPNEAFAALAYGCAVMIHEASLAPGSREQGTASHSQAADAARTAAEAGVGQLRLIHGRAAHAEASLAAARAIFPATEWAREGETIYF